MSALKRKVLRRRARRTFPKGAEAQGSTEPTARTRTHGRRDATMHLPKYTCCGAVGEPNP